MFLHLNWASNLTAVNNNESLLLLLLYIVYIHRTLSSTLTADSFPIVCFFTYFNLFYDRSMIVRIARKTQHFAVNIARKWIKKKYVASKASGIWFDKVFCAFFILFAQPSMFQLWSYYGESPSADCDFGGMWLISFFSSSLYNFLW